MVPLSWIMNSFTEIINLYWDYKNFQLPLHGFTVPAKIRRRFAVQKLIFPPYWALITSTNMTCVNIFAYSFSCGAVQSRDSIWPHHHGTVQVLHGYLNQNFLLVPDALALKLHMALCAKAFFDVLHAEVYFNHNHQTSFTYFMIFDL